MITVFSFQQQKNVRGESNWTKTDWTLFFEELEKNAKTGHQTTDCMHALDTKTLCQTVLDVMKSAKNKVIPKYTFQFTASLFTEDLAQLSNKLNEIGQF